MLFHILEVRAVERFALKPQRPNKLVVGYKVFLASLLTVVITTQLVSRPWLVSALAMIGLWGGLRLWERLRTPHVSVGIDGVLLEFPGKRRFIPHDEISSFTLERAEALKEASHLLLSLATEEEIRIPIACDVTETDGARLMSALRRHRPADDDQESEAPGLARAGKEPAKWLGALREMGRVGYRRGAVDVEQITRALDEALAPATRAAAAIVLSETSRDDAKKRLRIAADEYASPQTKRALLRIAGTIDDDALADALAELSREEADAEERGA